VLIPFDVKLRNIQMIAVATMRRAALASVRIWVCIGNTTLVLTLLPILQ